MLSSNFTSCSVQLISSIEHSSHQISRMYNNGSNDCFRHHPQTRCIPTSQPDILSVWAFWFSTVRSVCPTRLKKPQPTDAMPALTRYDGIKFEFCTNWMPEKMTPNLVKFYGWQVVRRMPTTSHLILVRVFGSGCSDWRGWNRYQGGKN